MIEVRYGAQYEVADLSGRSVKEVRKLFKDELGIPEKASARLNGKRINGKMEADTTLGECDTLSFTRPAGKSAFLIGALLMALVITGGVFAYGYTTASTSLDVVATKSDFAAVSVNNTDLPDWTPHGFFKGATGSGTLFNVDTATSGYDGDLTVTVSIANGDDLVGAYRVLAMLLEMRTWAGDIVDINGDTVNNTEDYALLTLGNGAVDLYVHQVAADNYTIWLKSGFYISNIWGLNGWAGQENPLLYCEVAQR